MPKEETHDFYGHRIGVTPYEYLEQGIIYLFQYGYITEDKHFKMLETLDGTKGRLTHKGRKF